MTTPRFFVLDGSGFMYRAFYGVKPLARRDGFPTQAVFGFLKMVRKMVQEHAPEYLAVVFDAQGPVFRHTLYPEYKATRQAMPDALRVQVPVIKRLVQAWNLASYEQAGLEADDLIATLARRGVAAGWEVAVVTSDKDLSQIVGEGIRIFDPVKERWIGPAEVEAQWGVKPEQLTSAMALIGDSSDNIPGVAGIGVKGAAELIRQFESLESLLSRAHEIAKPALRTRMLDPEMVRLARLSYRLVTIDDTAEVAFDPEGLRRRPPDREALRALLTEMEFAAELRALDQIAPPVVAPEVAPPVVETSDPTGYRAVTDAAGWQMFWEQLQTRNSFALDSETTGLELARAELVGLSFSWEGGQGYYIPVGHRPECVPGGQLERSWVLAALKPILEDPAIRKYGQNVQFELAILARYGIRLAGIEWDTLLISGLLYGATRRHNLDALALAELGRRTIAFQDVVGTGRKQVTFDQVPIERATPYACEDAEVVWQLVERLVPRLQAVGELETLYRQIELPLIPVLAAMEQAGARVDPGQLQKLSLEFAGRRAELTDRIHALAGESFNINSTQQLGEILFGRMGIKGGRRTKTGFSTDQEVLTRLAEEGHELPELVLEYRSLTKLQSTYTDALLERIDPGTGRVHTRFNQAATLTGRLSSSDPNLQNIPVRRPEGQAIRAAFVASNGHLLLAADYSQIELRLLAHMGQIPRLCQAFAQGLDIHAATAAELFGGDPACIAPEARRLAKTINFGLIYGMSPYGLAKRLKIPVGEAASYMALYFKRYEGVREYMDQTIRFAREHGHVTTLGGRRCYVADIDHTNRTLREVAERTAINAPLQGSAADLIKLAMIRLHRALQAESCTSRMILQVHDELVLEVLESELERVRHLTRLAMEGAMELTVPVQVDIGVGKNWAEAH
ncbi:MAG: DNA polymerase I [Magnetococcales bacterium]|nr:DNA polymerase I [Magnetococcales bacterium]NGZ05926.1 DNA polymerase I [Magnetococcales bacterium]